MKRFIAPITVGLAWIAVLTQVLVFAQRGLARGDSIVHSCLDCLGYFPVATNVFVGLVLGLPMFAAGRPTARWFTTPVVQAIACASILHVGITFHFLLAGFYEPNGVEFWTDLVMRRIVPPLFALHWFLSAPKQGLTFSQLPAFAVYPVLWFAWTLARGAVVGEYPYFFISPKDLQLDGALLNGSWLLAFYLIIVVILLAVTTKQRRMPA